MTQRIIPGLIICFWGVMTTLLVLLEVNPDKSNLLVVPPSHVLNLMFTHEQTSELEILESGHHVGNLMLQPKLGADPDGRALGFLGNILIRLPDSPKKQRVTWDGTLMMDHTLATTGLELTINLQDPPYHLHLGSISAVEKRNTRSSRLTKPSINPHFHWIRQA